MIKYSIIIPHKNIPKLLQRCLDSIPQRDDIQIIVVDDNSNGDVVDFTHFPGLNNPKTEVYFDKSSKGAGRARNIGIEHAKGKWVLFADCDDYFHTENLEELFSIQLPDDCNMVVWGIEHLYFDGSTWTDFVDELQPFRKLSNTSLILNRFAPWRKMIRRSFINEKNLHFEEIPASNDVMFHTYLMGCLDPESIMWFPKIIYTWQQRQESITHSRSLIKAESRFQASLRSNSYAISKNWGMIDSTNLYFEEIKKISNFHFYLAFYKEWYYLGLAQACADYDCICHKHRDFLLLYSNPFIIFHKMVRRFMKIV